MKPTILRPMPPSGRGFNTLDTDTPSTPQCVSTVQVVSGHDEEWRKKRYGEKWHQCTRPSTVILDGQHLCRRHAGERVLEQYLNGTLVKRDD